MLPFEGTHGWEYKSVKGTSRDHEEEANPKATHNLKPGPAM